MYRVWTRRRQNWSSRTRAGIGGSWKLFPVKQLVRVGQNQGVRVQEHALAVLDEGPAVNLCEGSDADPGCLFRIPDPDYYPSRIPDPKTGTLCEGNAKVMSVQKLQVSLIKTVQRLHLYYLVKFRTKALHNGANTPLAWPPERALQRCSRHLWRGWPRPPSWQKN
jgi:hypothetical protein